MTAQREWDTDREMALLKAAWGGHINHNFHGTREQYIAAVEKDETFQRILAIEAQLNTLEERAAAADAWKARARERLQLAEAQAVALARWHDGFPPNNRDLQSMYDRYAATVTAEAEGS